MKNKKRNLWDKFTVFSILLTMFQKEKTDAQFKKAPQFKHNTTSTWEAEAVVSGVQDYPDYILSLSLSRETLDPVSKNNDSKTECF